MLNWIVWNRTVSLYKNSFGTKYPAKVDMPWNLNKQTGSYSAVSSPLAIATKGHQRRYSRSAWKKPWVSVHSAVANNLPLVTTMIPGILLPTSFESPHKDALKDKKLRGKNSHNLSWAAATVTGIFSVLSAKNLPATNTDRLLLGLCYWKQSYDIWHVFRIVIGSLTFIQELL